MSDTPTEFIARVRRTLVPWFELESVSQLDLVRQAADLWSLLCDRIIIVAPSAAFREINNIFGKARNLIRNVEIILGVKTNPSLLGRPDNVAGWEQIAAAAQLAAKYGSADRILALDLELAWRDYVLGRYELDWVALRSGVGALCQAAWCDEPAVSQLVWYPAVAALPATENWTRERKFISAVREVTEAAGTRLRLVDFGVSGRDALGHPGARERTAYNAGQSDDLAQLSYHYQRVNDWRPADVVALLRNPVITKRPNSWLMPYVDPARWYELARQAVRAVYESALCDLGASVVKSES